MSQPDLQGREGPLHTLRDALGAARAGRGRLVLISGEAGIGKSALAGAFAAEVELEGVTVTWGRAWEFADAPPFFPLWPCLRALGVDAARQGGERHDEEEAFRLWETVLASLAGRAESETIVWVVEDLHAADLKSLDLLTFLVQPLRAMRALVVGTMRPDDPRLTDRKLQRLARIARDGLEVRLDPLGEREIALVAERATGSALGPEVLRRLVELTGGNPLFVVECARAAMRSGGLDRVIGFLPPTVRQVVLDRAALLPDATRDALASGAVLGREFAAATVARMHASDPARIIDTLLPALRAGILRETRPGQLVFSHAVVSSAIYHAISEAERVRLHQRAAVALAALGESADVLVERARHAIAAAACGEPEQALELARRAAGLLEREGAFDRAFDLHSRVDEARAAGFLPPASRAEALHIARVAREAGRSDVTRRLCEEVIASARLDGDVEALARAALLHASDVRVAVIDPWQISILEEAYRSLGDGSPQLACRVLGRLATALQPADDPSQPTDMAREALALARKTGDDAAILDVLDLAGLGGYYAPVSERVAWAEELRERALAAGDVAKALTAWMWLSYWYAETGDFSGFERAAKAALELSESAGHPRFRWGPLLLASGRALTLGWFEAADRYMTEVHQIAALIDDPALELSLVTHEVMRARLLRDPASLRLQLDKLDGVMGGIKRQEEFRAVVRAGCFARIEDVEATRAELAFIDLDSATRESDAMQLAFLGEALALAGSDEARRRIRADLLDLEATEVFGAGLSFTHEGAVLRVIGLLDAALNDLPGAEAKLRDAHAAARARGHAAQVAQLAHELATVLCRAGRSAEARVLRGERAELVRELGISELAPDELVGAHAPAPERSLRLERAGDVWTVGYGDRTARVKDSRGMQLLARLVDRPGEELHVLALASDEGLRLTESNAGEMLDDRAREAYRRRLIEIEEALTSAEARGADEPAQRLEHERQALVTELARATGLAGRARLAGSATERARVNVQRRLKAAMRQVAEVDEALGRILERAVRTGTYCCFRP